MSLLGGGSSTPPGPPPFNPIKIPQIAEKALTQDTKRYDDFKFNVFPGMADMRQNELNDAYKQLTSPLSPEFQSTFARNALATNAAVTGGGDPFSGMALQNGSAAKGAVSANFTRSALAKQDYDTSRFESLENDNPIPGLGLSQQDLLNLYVYNTNAQNASAMGAYTQGIAGANAAYQNNAATFGAIGNTISGLGNIYANYAMNSGQFMDTSAVPQYYGQGFTG